MEFSNNQTDVIVSEDKHIVVMAGAGSGKTTVLIERALHIIETGIIDNKVLILTFSNKAARELSKRAENRIGAYQEQMYIGTTHQFCLDVLINYGNTIGLPPDLQLFESIEDRMEIFKKAIDNFPEMREKYSHISDCSKLLKQDFDRMSLAKRNFEDNTDDAMYPVYQEYREMLLSQGVIDFDDILFFAYRILNEVEPVRRIYQRTYGSICVDEAQDLNYSQYEIIKKICGANTQLLLVGDPNQAIYGFNGSSSNYMCKQFKSDYHDVVEYTLVDNYRSSKKIIDAAKKIEPEFKLNGNIPLDGEFEVMCYIDENDEAEHVANKIETLLQYGHPDIGKTVELEEICVIARNRYVLDNVFSSLKAKGIDCVIKQSTSGFASESVFFNAFSLGLRLMINSKDDYHLSKLIELLGCENNRTIDDIVSGKLNSKFRGYNVLVEAWGELRLQEKVQQFNMTKIEKILDSFCNSESNFLNESEYYLVDKDYEAWKRRWKLYVESTTITERNLSGLLRSASMGSLNQVVEKGVVLSTVHMSKGLEFDVVFVISMNEGIFPDYRSTTVDSLQEEKHNLFVSITRSRRLCYLSYITKRNTRRGLKSQKPSPFIKIFDDM